MTLGVFIKKTIVLIFWLAIIVPWWLISYDYYELKEAFEDETERDKKIHEGMFL